MEDRERRTARQSGEMSLADVSTEEVSTTQQAGLGFPPACRTNNEKRSPPHRAPQILESNIDADNDLHQPGIITVVLLAFF
jgi:hypothetical protein